MTFTHSLKERTPKLEEIYTVYGAGYHYPSGTHHFIINTSEPHKSFNLI